MPQAESQITFRAWSRLRGYAIAFLAGALLVWLLPRGTPPIDAAAAPIALDPLAAPATEFDWRKQPEAAFPIPPYARFLEGVKIVLDPGHGGRSYLPDYKVGPTGLREEEVNLRVALFLAEFLRTVGAQVIMTRDQDTFLDKDMDVDLRLRATLANEARADLLLSIHHNAANDPEANYTTVFYHATPRESPASLCAARFLLSGLQDALRLESLLNCSLMSDFAIYPPRQRPRGRTSGGFAVLRQAEVPAVLTESSFHSNPLEESRLRDPLYNRREAYGMFLGLARWAQAGLPRIELVTPADGRLVAGKEALIRLDDGVSSRGGWGADLEKIIPSSLVVQLNGRDIGYQVDWRKRELTFTPAAADLAKGGRLHVDFANLFGQHVLHPRLDLSTK